MAEFCMTERDFGKLALSFTSEPNPHGEHFAPMKLVCVKDVKLAALAKFGSAKGLAERMATQAGGSRKQRARFAGGSGKAPGSAKAEDRRRGFAPSGNRVQVESALARAAAYAKAEADEAADAAKAEEAAQAAGGPSRAASSPAPPPPPPPQGAAVAAAARRATAAFSNT